MLKRELLFDLSSVSVDILNVNVFYRRPVADVCITLARDGVLAKSCKLATFLFEVTFYKHLLKLHIKHRSQIHFQHEIKGCAATE